MNPVRALWDYFKIDDPSTFRHDYIDKSINRERKPESPKNKLNVLEALNWYPSHYSAYEKKFLLKFDIFVFFFFAASFYTKFLDSSNISTAYVAGMKEHLDLNGNELNYFNTCYTIGFAVFQIPITLLITRPRYARYLMIVCEFVWGGLTLANAFAKTAEQVYVIRFFVGAAEACSYPATYVVFSSYLTDEELFKRAGWYGAFSAAGGASSGSLQTRSSESLAGVGGLLGYQWQFIIDAIITFGIALYGFLFFPGIPSTVKKFGFFTEDDMTFARKRLENKIAIPKRFTLKSLKETFMTWQLYVCTFLWTWHHQTFYDSCQKLYLKSRTDLYSSSEITDMITYLGICAIGPAILGPPLAHYYGRIPVFIFGIGCALYAAIILMIWTPENNPLMLSAFAISLGYRYGMAQMFYAWIATLCKDNVEKKAIVLSVANCMGSVFNAWLIPIQWDLDNSPQFSTGYKVNLGIVFIDILAFSLTYILDKYDLQLIPKFSGNRHISETTGEFKHLDEDQTELLGLGVGNPGFDDEKASSSVGSSEGHESEKINITFKS